MDIDAREDVSARPGQNESKTQFWRDHIDTWRQSDLTQRGYAKRNGLGVARFVYWKNKFYPTTPPRKKDFVPVKITTAEQPIRLIHSTGVMIECPVGTDVTWLRALLGLTRAS